MTEFDYTPLDANPGLASPLVARSDATVPRAAYAFFVFIGCGGLFILIGALSGLATARSTELSAAGQLYLLAWTAFGLVSGVTSLIVGIRWGRRANSRVPSTASRLTAFAAANGLEIERSVERIPVPGFHFNLPISPVEGNPALTQPTLRVRGSDPEFIVGDHWQPATSMFSSTLVSQRAFVAIKLDRKLPRIAMVPVAADSDLDLDPAQLHRLEGDFQRYFRLYCPEGYAVDALVVFTPDVMAAMVDDAQAWCAEIVDDWLHFTRTGPTLEAATADELRNAFMLVQTAGQQVNEQARRYSDDRVGDRSLNVVAERGRRLATSKPLWKVAAAIGLVYALIIVFIPAITLQLFFR